MSSDRTFGLLIFSTSVLMYTAASRFLRGNNHIVKASKPAKSGAMSRLIHGHRGVLIANDVTCDLFLSGMWKYVASKEEEEEGEEVEDGRGKGNGMSEGDGGESSNKGEQNENSLQKNGSEKETVNEEAEAKIELEIINDLDETILVCWVDWNGNLKHYYPVNDGSINDGSVSNKHIEFGYKNHSFICIRQPQLIIHEGVDGGDLRKREASSSDNIVGGSVTSTPQGTPTRVGDGKTKKQSKGKKRKVKSQGKSQDKKGKNSAGNGEGDKDIDGENDVQTIAENIPTSPNPLRSSQTRTLLPTLLKDVNPADFICIYRPNLGGYKHSLHLFYSETKLAYSSSMSVIPNPERPADMETTTNTGLRKGIKATVTCEKLEDLGELIDSSTKHYECQLIRGFKIMSEPGVFEENPSFLSQIAEDLDWCERLLPPSACELIKKDTPIWINKSMIYGPKKRPIVGRSCTYHPQGGTDWLQSMGMRLDKAGGIEVYTPLDYMESRGDWGLGGGLLHELSHSFHDKHCPDGFENSDICEAYNTSMAKKMYDAVNVHGSQGAKGPTKAYACANACEFFAELSTAFLWNKDETTEYNKWWPHNRYQLLKHDPASCEVLKKVWGV